MRGHRSRPEAVWGRGRRVSSSCHRRVCRTRPGRGNPVWSVTLPTVMPMRLRWLLLGLLVTFLLVPAVLLTAGRLLEPAGGTWVRLVAFTPFGVVLYAAAVLVLLLACFGHPSYWRAAARALTVVALVGVLMHAFWASGPYVGGPSAEAAGSGSLRVMTSNLRLGEADTAAVVEAAVHDKVDVLVLEEVTPWALAHLRAAGLYQAFDHAAGRPAARPARPAGLPS